MYGFTIQLNNAGAKEISDALMVASKLGVKIIGTDKEALQRQSVAYSVQAADAARKKEFTTFSTTICIQADHIDQARGIGCRLAGLPAYVGMPKYMRVL